MIPTYDYNNDLVAFIDDVCITIAGKRNTMLTNSERMVYSKAHNRLEAHGCNLIVTRGAQAKLYAMRDEIKEFKKLCAEDGIELRD